MKYIAKSLEEVLAKAAEDLKIPVEELNYQVVEETRGLFKKSVEIEVITIPDVIEFASSFLKKIIHNFGLDCEVTAKFEEDLIRLVLNTSHNSIIIGKNGKTLQSLNEIIRSGVNTRFKKRYRILLDINNYKNEKYEKLEKMARRLAKDVQTTRMPVTLDPMPADERRVIHNALSTLPHIKTESEGQGHQRCITIRYSEQETPTETHEE